MVVGRSRPGKGSRLPKNVKLRAIPDASERAKPRRKGTGKNARPDGDSSDEEEDEQDRAAREQFAQDGDDGEEEMMSKEDDKRPLEGMIVCSSGQLKQPREIIKTMCEALGAVFEQVLTTETTFLLADSTESDKYKACVENGIPVIQSTFILEAHHRWLELIDCNVFDLSNYLRLPPLQNLTICLTGYGDDRDNHRAVITQSGGAAYSPELTNEVTHLVVGPAFQSRDELLHNGKYLYAKQINNKRSKREESRRPIWIVWGEWLEHSLCAFGRVKEESYSTDVVPDRSKISPPPAERSQDILARRDSASPKKLRKQKTRDDHAQIKSKRKLIKQESKPSLMEDPQTASAKRAAQGVDDDLPSKRAKMEWDTEQDLPTIEGDDTAQEPLEPAAVKKQSPSLSTNPLNAKEDEASSSSAPKPPMKKQRSSTHMELMGVQDLLTPKQEEQSQIQMSVAPTSSTSSVRTKMDNMHTSAETPSSNSLLSKMSKARSNKFVSRAKESTPALSGPEVSASTSSLKAGKQEAESLDMPLRSASPAAVSGPPETLVDMSIPEEEPPFPCSPIFKGKTFYVIHEDFDAELRSRIAILMVERGAINIDQLNDEVDYIVCKTISNEDPTFDLEDSRLITADWVEACMAFDDIIEDIALVEAFKKPLRCVLPLPGITESRICVSYSGFDADYEKPKLISWLDTLGIPHEPFIRKKDMDGKLKTTHIIIPDQSYRSQRLGTAQEWGIQVVLPQWIRDLALRYPVQRHSAPTVEAPIEVESSNDSQAYGSRDPSDDFLDDAKPLEHCRVHVPRKIQDWRDLEKLATRLGARTIQIFDADNAKAATHLLFQSSQSKPTSRDYALALQNRVKIVHPDWLKHTAQKGIRQAEASYKHTRNSKRGLQVVVESQSMSRISSSSSGKSVYGAPLSDEYTLPPPLKKSGGDSPGVSAETRDQPMSRNDQVLQSPASPARPLLHPSSSATLDSTPERICAPLDGADETDGDLTMNVSAVDDSGFIASASKEKAKTNITSADATSSGSAVNPHATADTSAGGRNIMAEMAAIMQANDLTPQQLSARLPFQQQGGYQNRTTLRKSITRGADSASPNASLRSASGTIVEASATALARRQAFAHYEETQFGQNRSDETQTQGVLDEQTMVIRINDPVAEARKAQTLAELRRAGWGDKQNDAVDVDSTQRSSEETAKPSSRRSRSGNPATKRRI